MTVNELLMNLKRYVHKQIFTEKEIKIELQNCIRTAQKREKKYESLCKFST